MKASIIFHTILWLGSFCMSLEAQVPDRKEPKGGQILGSNAEGYHFIVGFMQNELDYNQTIGGPWGGCDYGYGQRTISIASRFATHVTIRTPGVGLPIERNLGALQVWTLTVDRYYECIGEGVFQKGIEIEATEPVSVYCFNSRVTTSDGYQALPMNSWGTQYISANYYLDYYDSPDSLYGTQQYYCDTHPRGGELAVISGFDSTIVTVVPAASTLEGVSRGAYYTKVLRKGEIFQVQDGGRFKGESDLTGSVITSNKPVGLLSGHVRTAIPYTLTSRDHLIEMIPPRNTLGKRYMVVPFGGRFGGDVVRIIAAESGTTTFTVQTADETKTYTLNGIGEFVSLTMKNISVITANKAVMVAQYSQSYESDPRNWNRPYPLINFDPYMVMVTPEEQFVNAAVFQTQPSGRNASNNGNQFDHHYMTIVAESQGFDSIIVNGENLSTNPALQTGTIPNTTYRWATLELPSGMIHTIEGPALFGGYVYGLGEADSYGWPIGAGLRKFDMPDGNPPGLEAVKICGGYDVVVKDSGFFETGLARVWLDQSQSFNTRFTPAAFVSRGIEFALGRVTLIDARKDGSARIKAQDLDGNIAEIDVPILNRSPKFSKDSIGFDNVAPDVTVSDMISVSNPSGIDITIDTLMLMHNQGFALDKIYTGAFTLAAGETIDVKVSFAGSTRRTYYDTLLVVANCEQYKTPLRATIPSPAISVHDIDYDSVRVGTQKCMTLRVRSTGAGPLRIDSLHLEGGGYAISTSLTFPFEIEPGRDTTLTVCFIPLGTYKHPGTVRFFNNSGNDAVSTLTGVGIYPRLSIGSYDFGLVQVGDTTCATVPIVNMGTDTAHLTGLELATPGNFLPNQSVFPRKLAPGDTLWVPICFAPTDEVAYKSDIFPQNTDGLEDASNKVLGQGYRLLASISGYDWKNRWVGTSHDTVVFVRNRGNEPITITDVWIAAGDISDFYLTEPLSLPFTLAKGEVMPVKVGFTPMLAGVRSALIHASTSSRVAPEIDSVLQGFGLIALASDSLALDTTLAYSCSSRNGQVIIYNDGNTPLTISSIWTDTAPPQVIMNAPSPGYQIAVGDNLVLDFTVDFTAGPDVAGMFYWRFEELPDTFSQSFAVQSEPQEFFISGKTPASYSIGEPFDLVVMVDSSHWEVTPHSGIELRIEFNPTVAHFGEKEWQPRLDTSTIAWIPTGPVVEEKPGVLVLNFIPRQGTVAALDSLVFPAIPFWGYLGNADLDTFRITMSVIESECAPPALTNVPYQIDSLCGLNYRLMEFTGDPYTLKQNTPNPVRGRTSISFTLGMEAMTTLEVFSSDGRLVQTLVNRELPAGEYTIPLDARDLSSGLYYYRLISGPYRAIQHMLVTK